MSGVLFWLSRYCRLCRCEFVPKLNPSSSTNGEPVYKSQVGGYFVIGSGMRSRSTTSRCPRELRLSGLFRWFTSFATGFGGRNETAEVSERVDAIKKLLSSARPAPLSTNALLGGFGGGGVGGSAKGYDEAVKSKGDTGVGREI